MDSLFEVRIWPLKKLQSVFAFSKHSGIWNGDYGLEPVSEGDLKDHTLKRTGRSFWEEEQISLEELKILNKAQLFTSSSLFQILHFSSILPNCLLWLSCSWPTSSRCSSQTRLAFLASNRKYLQKSTPLISPFSLKMSACTSSVIWLCPSLGLWR